MTKKPIAVGVLLSILLVSGSCNETGPGSTSGNPSDEKEPLLEQLTESSTQNSDSTNITVNQSTEMDIESADLAEDDHDDPAKVDAEAYAKLYGITLEEAMHRLELQEKAGVFGAELEQNESDIFTGFWIEHEPQFKLVASFTKNVEETIEKYRDKYPELVAITQVVNNEYSYEQLREAQEKVTLELRQVGLSFASTIDVVNNRVELYITDNDLFYSVLEKYDIELPDCVRPVITYEPLNQPPQGLNPDTSVHMAQLKVKGGSMDALLKGTLKVVDGYLRVKEYLIIWQPDFFVNNNNGKIEIWDRDGNVVGIVGEGIQMGGGEGHGIPYSSLTESIPDTINGPIWIQGEGPEIVPGYDEEDLLNLRDLSVDDILQSIANTSNDEPSSRIEGSGTEQAQPLNRPVYVNPDAAKYVSASGEYSGNPPDESWLLSIGFQQGEIRTWSQNGQSGQSKSYFLVSKPSITLQVNLYAEFPNVYEFVVTENLLLSKPYDAEIIPGDVDHIYLVSSVYGSTKIADAYTIMELRTKVNSLPVKPDCVILGGLESELVFTMRFHSVSRGDIFVKSIAGGPNSGINIDGYPILNDTHNVLKNKVTDILRNN